MARLVVEKPVKRNGIFVPPRRDDPEIDLMLRVQRDEPGAFAELVGHYWPRVCGRFCRWLTDRQEAEDLAQDVFLRLYRSRKRYQPRARFSTWLYHISRNVARNALRSRRRHPCLRMGSLAAFEEETPHLDRQEAPSRPLERSELIVQVREAVSRLACRQRTALELHQFQDRSYAEIASTMDMTLKATKSLLYRARNQLRVNLSEMMIET
jgi:RNA polymerase sigma-70 factor, ECF subfamily